MGTDKEALVAGTDGHQCHLSVPISTTYQCLLISAHHCHLSVSISATYQCPSL
ncbi:unnamed protein product, partial [Staurois parvus]